MTDSNIQDWMDWASGLTGAGEGDPLLSATEIEAIVDGVVGQMGQLTDDPGEIPTTATARPRGAFDSPNDLQAYLERGGLVSVDDSGNIIPNPIVNILKQTIPGRANPIYEVWINDDTP